MTTPLTQRVSTWAPSERARSRVLICQSGRQCFSTTRDIIARRAAQLKGRSDGSPHRRRRGPHAPGHRGRNRRPRTHQPSLKRRECDERISFSSSAHQGGRDHRPNGPLSFMGIANANVAKMVIDDINANGGLLGRRSSCTSRTVKPQIVSAKPKQRSSSSKIKSM